MSETINFKPHPVDGVEGQGLLLPTDVEHSTTWSQRPDYQEVVGQREVIGTHGLGSIRMDSDNSVVEKEEQLDKSIRDMLDPRNVIELKDKLEHSNEKAISEGKLSVDATLDKDGSRKDKNEKSRDALKEAMVEDYIQTGANPENPREVPDKVKSQINDMLELSFEELEARIAKLEALAEEKANDSDDSHLPQRPVKISDLDPETGIDEVDDHVDNGKDESQEGDNDDSGEEGDDDIWGIISGGEEDDQAGNVGNIPGSVDEQDSNKKSDTHDEFGTPVTPGSSEGTSLDDATNPESAEQRKSVFGRARAALSGALIATGLALGRGKDRVREYYSDTVDENGNEVSNRRRRVLAVGVLAVGTVAGAYGAYKAGWFEGIGLGDDNGSTADADLPGNGNGSSGNGNSINDGLQFDGIDALDNPIDSPDAGDVANNANDVVDSAGDVANNSTGTDIANAATEINTQFSAADVQPGDYLWDVMERAGIPEQDIMPQIKEAANRLASETGANVQWHDIDGSLNTTTDQWLSIDGISDTESLINKLSPYLSK